MTLSERLILRAWMREVRVMQEEPGHPGTREAERRAAEATGVHPGRVMSLVLHSTYAEREEVAA